MKIRKDSTLGLNPFCLGSNKPNVHNGNKSGWDIKGVKEKYFVVLFFLIHLLPAQRLKCQSVMVCECVCFSALFGLGNV